MGARAAFLTDFVGRAEEVEELLALAKADPLVTLVGPGGIGKTRLAHEVLDATAPEMADRVWFVELADVHDPMHLGPVICAAMQVSPSADPFEPAILVEAVGPAPAMLVLDNCEQLLTACADLVTALLRGCPDLRILATSRQALGVIGESVYQVPSLTPGDAAALFATRARAASPSWTLALGEEARLDQLCRELDGLPLAIELVATQVRIFPTSVLLDRLHDSVSAMAVGRGESRRLSSVEASISWSHDLCTTAERLLWHRLSVFAGGFSFDATEHACIGDGLERRDVLSALAGLVDKSVVVREPGSDRYRMLELIRQFGLDRLESEEGPATWQRRHRDYYRDLALRFDAEWWGPDQVAWMSRLHQERRNLILALDFSASSGDGAGAVLQMAVLLEHYFASTGGGTDAVRWLRSALAHDAGTDLERANALRVGSFVANLVNQMDDSAEFHDLLAQLAQSTGDRRVLAHALYAESQWRTYSGDIDAGILAATEGVALLAELGDEPGMPGLLGNLHFLLGMILGWADRADDAAAAYRACLEVLEPRGERWLTSYSQWGLGVDALTSGELERALRLERTALRAKAEFGDQLGIGLTLEAVAWIYAVQGRAREAGLLLGGAEAIWARIGMSVAAMPYLSRRRESGVATIKEQVTAREYDNLTAQGRGLPRETAVALALGEVRAPEPTTGQPLTRREREVAELLAEGATNREIAGRLVVSVRTVETHVEHVLRKLGAPTRADVAAALAAKARAEAPG